MPGASGETAAKKAKKVCKVKFADSWQKVFLSGELMIIHMHFTVYHARSQFPVLMWE